MCFYLNVAKAPSGIGEEEKKKPHDSHFSHQRDKVGLLLNPAEEEI